MPPRLKVVEPERSRANRTSRNGCIRFDRDLRRIGVGRIQMSSGTDDPREFEYRNDTLTLLIERNDLDTLRALKCGEISIEELVAARRKRRLDSVLADARAARAHPARDKAALVYPAVHPVGSGVRQAVQGPIHTLPPSPFTVGFPLVHQTLGTGGEVAQPTAGAADMLRALLGIGRGPGDSGASVVAHLAAAIGVIGMHAGWPGGPAGHAGGPAADACEVSTGAGQQDPRTAPLWETLINRVIPLLECGADTKRRYKTSLESLRRRLLAYTRDEHLEELRAQDPVGVERDYPADAVEAFHALASETAVVSDLTRVHKRYWRSLQAQWGKSAADWNHVRRAISATLSGFCGSDDHPFRRAVVRAIPTADEGSGRVPDLTPELFWTIVDLMPDHARTGPVVLVATGMRLKEYFATTRQHLLRNTFGIMVPGTKTADSRNTVYVAAEIWPWIDAGVPAPLGRKWLWTYWDRARKAAGVPNVRLHDLRHCLGQWATDAGVPEKSVQWALRHRDPNMTRRYTQTRGKREVAVAMGNVLRRRADDRTTR